MYLRQSCSHGSRWIKPHVRRRTRTNTYMWDFPDIIKFRVAAHTISEKAISFRHPEYNPDRAQKLISLSTSRHLSTHHISSKSMQAFLVILRTDRQTDKWMWAKIYTSYCVGGKQAMQHSLGAFPLQLLAQNASIWILAQYGTSLLTYTRWCYQYFVVLCTN